MTDLRNRFRTLDKLSAPNLWYDIEERALAMQPTRRRGPLVLIVVMLLLALAVGGAVLVGSGIVKLPISVDASLSPSASAHESTAASSSPISQVPASWTATGAMREARTNQTATQLLDGRVLVAGGFNPGGSDSPANILASAELYDPSTGQWTATGAMLGVRTDHTATLLPDGKVLVVGGSGCSDFDGCPLAAAELYDPNKGTWTATTTMLEAHGGGHTATLLNNGKVLVAGGNGSSFESLASAELYDPITRSWSTAARMVAARGNHTATLLLNGKVLVAGGSDPASAELYDPNTGRWTVTGSMVEGRIRHTATLLSNGKVLVAGSMGGTDASPSAELYDPNTGRWTVTGSMLNSLVYHTATLLPGGKVLVAGGAGSVIDPSVSPAAELYDPATGSWTATVNMVEGRNRHTATLLPGGMVLVTGGSGSNGALTSAEVYDPGSGT